MGKFFKIPDGVPGAVGIAAVTLLTMWLVFRVVPVKVKTTIVGG